jgi:gamma-glutamylcyclotransferase (GGCT)/AIG2-like uncharacterized protein YtfP
MPYMFLSGGGMRGGSLHHLLRGAPLVAETRTAPIYRLYSVGDRYPALQPAEDAGGAIAGEVYDLPLDVLRDDLLPAEPAELELGVIKLADGTAALGMILRRPCPVPDDLADITGYGGWRNYLAGRGPGLWMRHRLRYRYQPEAGAARGISFPAREQCPAHCRTIPNLTAHPPPKRS